MLTLVNTFTLTIVKSVLRIAFFYVITYDHYKGFLNMLKKQYAEMKNFLKNYPREAISIAIGIIFLVLFLYFVYIKQTNKNIVWKTYTSKEKGYAFTYRGDYVILAENGYGVTLSTADDHHTILRMDVSRNLSDTVVSHPYAMGKTTLGGISARYFFINAPDNSAYYVIRTEKNPKLTIKITLASALFGRKVVTPFFQNVLSSFTFLEKNQDSNLPSPFITYHSTAAKYSVQIPATWTVVIPQIEEDPHGYLLVDPENEIGVHLNGLSIRVQPASPDDTQWHDRYAHDSFSQRSTYDTRIAGYPALIKYQFHKSPPLTAKAIDWYNGPDKETYVDIGNNMVVVFQAKWDRAKPYYETAMDTVIASLHIDK